MIPLKPFKTLEEQAEIILSRGCSGEKSDLIDKLKFVNYYRFSGYLYPYRDIDPVSSKRLETFVPGTTFDEVWNTYRFDRRLRIILLDAIERIEIALRTRVAYLWSESTKAPSGATCSNPQNDPALINTPSYSEFLSSVKKYYKKSTADCAVHHKAIGIKKVEDLPIWVFVEFTTFGNFCSLIDKYLPTNVKTALGQSLGIPKTKKLSSTISFIKEIRNACAHHGRVWNRNWSYKSKGSAVPVPIAPELPDQQNIEFSSVVRTKTGYFLLLCDFLLQKNVPGSRWKSRLKDLFAEIKVDPLQMGFKTKEAFEKWIS